jgi:nucleotide-binding universal stress UspA family protein
MLVAVDGSATSAEAARVAVDQAVDLGADVTFVHVVPLVEPGPMGIAVPALVARRIREFDRAPLLEAARVARASGVPAQAVLLQGDVVDEIVGLADSLEADMIVAGESSHGRVATALRGSVARGVSSRSDRPVVLVHASGDRRLPERVA